jgi:imidazolonepropionase-like amidohydrolase
VKTILTAVMLLAILSIKAQNTILINNVEIFNGKDEKTIMANLLIVNNIISKISTLPIVIDKRGETTVIDGKRKFLMPGLIDAHMHESLSGITQKAMIEGDIAETHISAGIEANNILLRGFTSIRDMGGPSFGIKSSIDKGLINGPRFYPSGSMISQTSGHGDFRSINERPLSLGGSLHYSERLVFVLSPMEKMQCLLQ